MTCSCGKKCKTSDVAERRSERGTLPWQRKVIGRQLCCLQIEVCWDYINADHTRSEIQVCSCLFNHWLYSCTDVKLRLTEFLNNWILTSFCETACWDMFVFITNEVKCNKVKYHVKYYNYWPWFPMFTLCTARMQRREWTARWNWMYPGFKQSKSIKHPTPSLLCWMWHNKA